MRLVTGREMQRLDRLTIDGGHVPALVLMERAGRAVAAAALDHLEAHPSARVAVVCGKGNNGGDGLVAARVLAAHGLSVHVHLTHPAESMSENAAANFSKLGGTGVAVRRIPEVLPEPKMFAGERDRPRFTGHFPDVQGLEPELAAWVSELSEASVCIDALLGTGASEVRGRFAALIDWLNRASRTTIAVDLPSGIDADTGAVRGNAVWADRTVTFGLPKIGLVVHPGRNHAGTLQVADIGFPDSIVRELGPGPEWMDHDLARAWFPPLDPEAHKYARGALVVLAGSRDYPGAAALAASAALRSGAGLVHLVVPAGIRTLLQAKLTEVIVHGAPETAEGTLAPGFEPAIAPLLERARAVALGPGLGSARATLDAVAGFLGRLRLPAVVDADAIVVLEKSQHAAPRIATPHAGELARWTGESARTALDRFALASRAAAARGVVVLAKGAPTCVATPDGRLLVNSTGHAGLATAGSGDVLTGIVGGLLAQGCEAIGAAALGAWLHGRAAERVAGSPRSLVAGDLIGALGGVFQELESPAWPPTHANPD